MTLPVRDLARLFAKLESSADADSIPFGVAELDWLTELVGRELEAHARTPKKRREAPAPADDPRQLRLDVEVTP